MDAQTINYLAVLVAGIAQMVLGFLWYSPLMFAKPWSAYMGWENLTPEEIRAKQASARPMYIASMIGALITSIVIAHFLYYTDSTTIQEAMQLATWAWIGFLAPATFTGDMFTGKPKGFWAINAFYQLVCFNVAAIILVLWT